MCLRKFGVKHIKERLLMSSLYIRIDDLCKRNRINMTTMCKESGASRASLTDLKMGRKQSLSADTLSKISAYFHVSVDYLLGNEDKEKPSGTVAEGPETAKDQMIRDIVNILNSSSVDEVERCARMLAAFFEKDTPHKNS